MKPTWLIRLIALMIVLAILAAQTFPLWAQKWEWPPYTVYSPPTRSVFLVEVRLLSSELVRKQCGGAIGCYKPYIDHVGKPLTIPLIIAPAPQDFNDKEALSVLGHEVLHTMGANHD